MDKICGLRRIIILFHFISVIAIYSVNIIFIYIVLLWLFLIQIRAYLVWYEIFDHFKYLIALQSIENLPDDSNFINSPLGVSYKGLDIDKR